ncbi:MAG: phosphoribosylformylglycinamidine cyclo-ligase [Armatimonadetes bacterium]|nr:phosphoribosylformylglycinamidine cyclo-ligase [Armatimonadota bacterium]
MERLTYQEAGVDVEAKERLMARLLPRIRATFTAGVLSDIGTFGALFALGDHPGAPVLVATMDGVGTKTKVAAMAGRHEVVGGDLVRHSVNDLVVQGARPLFLLDYLAASRLDPAGVEAVITGMGAACREEGVALVGGETAEMPGVYREGEYDVVGCMVGVVARDRIVDGSGIVPGDAVIGLASTGLHTNGYSLARAALFERARLSLHAPVPGAGEPVGEALLRPHRCYGRAILRLLDEVPIKGMAHITGGGIPGNLIRTLPAGCRAVIRRQTWVAPPIFTLIQRAGGVPDEEMFRTFNMGVGFVLVVAAEDADRAVRHLREFSEEAWIAGEITAGERGVEIA